MIETDFQNTKEIFEKAKNGDKEAFSEIYEAYFEPIYRYVYLKIGNKIESDDLVQDVFIKALSTTEGCDFSYLSPIVNFYIVARKSVLDWKRKRRRTILHDDGLENYFGDVFSYSEKNPSEEEFDNFQKSIKELPSEYQDAVILRFAEGLSSNDISTILEVSDKSTLHLEAQGLISIRDILKQGYESKS